MKSVIIYTYFFSSSSNGFDSKPLKIMCWKIVRWGFLYKVF